MGRHARALGWVLTLGAIVVATLVYEPTRSLPRSGNGRDQSAWEAFLNVALYLPFGAVVAWSRPPRPVVTALVGGALLSGAVELIQLGFLPSRTASIGDVACNALGAALGAAAVRSATT